MDRRFKEEQKHLQETENRIDLIVRKHREKISLLSSELNDFYTVDYNDVDEKRRLRGELQRQQDEANKYEEYRIFVRKIKTGTRIYKMPSGRV